MNKKILHTEVQDFIEKNLNADLPGLILKGAPFAEISMQELAAQISSKSKCLSKLPTWFNAEKIYYPKPVHIEQTSSEITAQYKSALISGQSLLDMTGGFGVDSYYFSKKVEQVTYCEHNTALAEIVKHNFDRLGVKNIRCEARDGIVYLMNSKLRYDWIYIDPSRRNTLKEKVFRLEDCSPDVTTHLDGILEHTDQVMFKLSPLIDISATISSLASVQEIHIVAVKNEVKELLVLIKKGFIGPCSLKAVQLTKGKIDVFKGMFRSEATATYSLPEKYLYEPNSAILKSGLFDEVSFQLKISKLHNNSHLYTSDKLIEFPGRRFEILGLYKYNKKLLKKMFGAKKANITTRNFQETVAQIRIKTGIKEGGDDFLFFTTDLEGNAVVIYCCKV